MSETFKRVSIIGTGSFLPNKPVANDKVADILGELKDAPKKVKQFEKNISAGFLEESGIQNRYFAIDPKTFVLTHTIADMGEEAARNAIKSAGINPDEIDLLLLSSHDADHTTPPTSTILQQKLGINYCAEMFIHSNCSGVGKCVQIAYDALRTGRYKTALVVYTQLSSSFLRSNYYNHEKVDKTQILLRYILSDGAGALILKSSNASKDDNVKNEIITTLVESVGCNDTPGMTSGKGIANATSNNSSLRTMFNNGSHHWSQDYTAVNQRVIPILADSIIKLVKQAGLSNGDIKGIITSVPLYKWIDKARNILEELGLSREIIKFRAAQTGYCGGAATLLHLDEAVRNNEFKQGDLITVSAIESSKWMSAGFIICC